ncbi:MAG: hypothetical protein U9Q58_02300, partial [Pseudomonadota bacterium]|nr:hypothetical protein [Pseudomonadota bacterium]
YRVISLHFLSKIFVFPALTTPKLRNSFVPHSNSRNFLAPFAGKNDKILRDVPENNPKSLEIVTAKFKPDSTKYLHKKAPPIFWRGFLCKIAFR